MQDSFVPHLQSLLLHTYGAHPLRRHMPGISGRERQGRRSDRHARDMAPVFHAVDIGQSFNQLVHALRNQLVGMPESGFPLPVRIGNIVISVFPQAPDPASGFRKFAFDEILLFRIHGQNQIHFTDHPARQLLGAMPADIYAVLAHQPNGGRIGRRTGHGMNAGRTDFPSRQRLPKQTFGHRAAADIAYADEQDVADHVMPLQAFIIMAPCAAV